MSYNSFDIPYTLHLFAPGFNINFPLLSVHSPPTVSHLARPRNSEFVEVSHWRFTSHLQCHWQSFRGDIRVPAELSAYLYPKCAASGLTTGPWRYGLSLPGPARHKRQRGRPPNRLPYRLPIVNPLRCSSCEQSCPTLATCQFEYVGVFRLCDGSFPTLAFSNLSLVGVSPLFSGLEPYKTTLRQQFCRSFAS